MVIGFAEYIDKGLYKEPIFISLVINAETHVKRPQNTVECALCLFRGTVSKLVFRNSAS